MNYRNIIYMLSMLLLVFAAGMGISALVGYFNDDTPSEFRPMLICAGTIAICSIAGLIYGRHKTNLSKQKKFFREGFLSVALAWGIALFVGALPYVTCGKLCWADAIFETASGLTTTGATVIELNLKLRNGLTLAENHKQPISNEQKKQETNQNAELIAIQNTKPDANKNEMFPLPKTILFWRCFTNWMGGIGFVMLGMLLLPVLGGAKQLFNAEVPGLKNTGEQFTPRIVTTARLSIACYVIWTFIVMVGYRVLGMGTWFDAACHTFATVATGGFSNYSESFGHFPQPALQWFSGIAMFISAIDLMLLVKLLFFGKLDIFKDEQTYWFLAIVVAATLLFRFQLGEVLKAHPKSLQFTNGTSIPNTIEAELRTAFFQVISIITTTGFTTSDYVKWNLPGLSGVMILIMVFGGCGGSTAGGLKIVRFIVLVKQAILDLKQKIFPHLVPNVHVGGDTVPSKVVVSTLAFFFLFISTITICTILLPLISKAPDKNGMPVPMDFETALSAAVTSVSNVGPGLSKLSPSCSFAWMSAPAKILLSLAMITGRLELYTILILCLPSFWHTKKQILSNK